MSGSKDNSGQQMQMLLGKNSPVVTAYAPQLLYPIPRDTGRAELGLGASLPMYGTDLWHAYELSWLDNSGKPVVWVGRLSIPATSPNIVESKSLKLYLNSLNNNRFGSAQEAIDIIEADVGRVVGERVSLQLLGVGDSVLSGCTLPGTCLDDLGIDAVPPSPLATSLHVDSSRTVDEAFHSHLLRSLCPVTGQPDWASIWVQYRGKAIEAQSLLAYLISYRCHRGFHEQCVERIYTDIIRHCQPEALTVQAFYTRRGGLDINPLRSTSPAATAMPRLNRQ